MKLDPKSLIKGWRKISFYVRNFTYYYLPSSWWRHLYNHDIKHLTESEKDYAQKRTEYYLNLPENAKLDTETSVEVGSFKYPFGQKKKFSGYFFDLFSKIRCGKSSDRFNYLFGDIVDETPSACFVKSRPITGGKTRSVLMQLDSTRHFFFVKDKLNFRDKKNMLVFRNLVYGQQWRIDFLKLYHNHPMVDAGQTNTDNVTDPRFIKPFMTIDKQLEYKFISCIEGHDVATNLKWVMSSNSVAVMPRPKIESWFMEGTLIGDYHYIEVKPDYSDVIEKIQYYIGHPDEAEAIIRHAHEYVAQFRNKKRETLIGRMVAMRYFELTNNKPE